MSKRKLGADASILANAPITLEPADDHNVEMLIQWALEPVAQGPHKPGPHDVRPRIARPLPELTLTAAMNRAREADRL